MANNAVKAALDFIWRRTCQRHHCTPQEIYEKEKVFHAYAAWKGNEIDVVLCRLDKVAIEDMTTEELGGYVTKRLRWELRRTGRWDPPYGELHTPEVKC